MKTMILAAAVLAAAGSAYARGDGGCITKPGKPKAVSGQGASLKPLVTICTNPKGCK